MLEVRAATDDDLPAVLDLLGASLGWVPDEQHRAYFEWKHLANPYGRSAMWVADDDGAVVAFRALMRWELERDGAVLRAVRAVDTATHPDAQGKGLFTKLTLGGVDAMRTEGVAFVFNTPNTQSRPGYLKMGWRDVGRLPIHVRPRSLRSVARIASARVPADKWSVMSDAGVAAVDALADTHAVDALLASMAPARAGDLRTRRTPASLAWRYGFAPLAYRVLPIGDGLGDGVIVFRVRARGPALEAAICEILAPAGRSGAVRAALRRVLRLTGADYAIALGPARRLAEGIIPLPGQGPRLTWRDVCETTQPALGAWDLALGDVELL